MEFKDRIEGLENLGVVSCSQKIGDTSFFWQIGKSDGLYVIKTYLNGNFIAERKETDFNLLLTWMNADILDQFAETEDCWDTDRDPQPDPEELN